MPTTIKNTPNTCIGVIDSFIKKKDTNNANIGEQEVSADTI